MATDAPSPISAILVATDFSPHAERALEVARGMAAQFGAHIHLLHVLKHPDDAIDRQGAVAHLGAVAARIVPCTTALVSGHAAREIVRYATEHRIGMIVMGTHGRSGLSHALRGSVAEETVRTARCHVLTVHLTPAAAAAHAPAATTPTCLLCGRPSARSICEACQARVQGEILERKKREHHEAGR